MLNIQPKCFLLREVRKALFLSFIATFTLSPGALKAGAVFEDWNLSDDLSNTIYAFDRKTQSILLTVNPCSIGKGFWLNLIDTSNSLLTLESNANLGIALGLMRIDELDTNYVNFYVSKGSKEINLGGLWLEDLLFDMWGSSVLRLQANSSLGGISNNLEQHPITLSFSLKGLSRAVEEANKYCFWGK